MLLLTTLLIVSTQFLAMCYSTRLPLEVYELTPSNTNPNNNHNPAGIIISTTTNLKHKNLEYATINAAGSTGNAHQPPEEIDLKILSSSKDHTQQSQLSNQLDRRRSRQMLDMLKSHHDLTITYNKLHNNGIIGLDGSNNGNNGANLAGHHNGKDVRILYQVGVSILNLFFTNFNYLII